MPENIRKKRTSNDIQNRSNPIPNNFWNPQKIEFHQKHITSDTPIQEALEYVIEEYAYRQIFEQTIQFQQLMDGLEHNTNCPQQQATNTRETMLSQLCNNFCAKHIHDAFHAYITNVLEQKQSMHSDDTDTSERTSKLVQIRRALKYDELAKKLLPENIYAIFTIGGINLVFEHYVHQMQVAIEFEDTWTMQAQ